MGDGAMNVSLGEFVLTADEIRETLCVKKLNDTTGTWERATRSCGHGQSAAQRDLPCQACVQWENPPKVADPSIDDLRVITEPGANYGVWFHIEKYCAKQKWSNEKNDYVDNVAWWNVDKCLSDSYDKGTVYRWSRDEDRAMARATKMIQKQFKREADYEARKSRIKNGTKTFRIVTDR